jgi:hypothetical protein
MVLRINRSCLVAKRLPTYPLWSDANVPTNESFRRAEARGGKGEVLPILTLNAGFTLTGDEPSILGTTRM